MSMTHIDRVEFNGPILLKAPGQLRLLKAKFISNFTAAAALWSLEGLWIKRNMTGQLKLFHLLLWLLHP